VLKRADIISCPEPGSRRNKKALLTKLLTATQISSAYDVSLVQ
jgi:hypothetical protein